MSNDLNYSIGSTERRPTQFPILYCNGIEATKEQAAEQASIISTAFGEREVSIVYNPTKVGEYFETVSVEKIATQLVNQVRTTLEVSKKVLIFAHSHGSHVTEEALKILNPEERAAIRVYTFGGVTVIPKKLAGVVESYIYKGDWIARLGNRQYGPKDVLENFIRLSDKAQSKTLTAALFEEVVESEIDRIDPADPANRGEYFQLFWSTEGQANHNLCENKTANLVASFTDYNIRVLDKPAEEPSDMEVTASALSNAVTSHLPGLFLRVDEQFHRLSNFKEEINAIAQSIIKEEES